VKSIAARFAASICFAAVLAANFPARGEAMLELFNVSWADITAKMPEIAEAGYDAIWVPPPARAGGPGNIYSVGYDQYDPFDLGDSSPTRWGTKAQLQTMVQTAHRFGIRIYLDNVMNHRGFTVPGYNASTPTTFYPGLVPQDFHLQTSGNYYVNTIGIADWGITWDIQNESLEGLVDLANEPGSVNLNFGSHLGSQITKTNFVRHPGQNTLYMDLAKPVIEGSPWRPFNGTNGVPVSEDVNSYLIRSVLYTLDQTKCDGFRLDAVKAVPSGFFGDTTSTFNGYCGAIQAMFDYVHGYGANVTGNGYNEPNDNRDSLFNLEAARNDAMIFGEAEYMPSDGQEWYGDYISRGMRLINFNLRDQFNDPNGGALNGKSSLYGLEKPDANGTAISPLQGIQFACNQDGAQQASYTVHRELQDVYNLMHEGEGVIYSDGNNQSGAPNYFPSIANANYLGEYGDNQMPDLCYLHNQLARGYTTARWGDYNICAFERYDYRESSNAQDETVVLFVMNDNFGNPGDIAFDDGVGQTYDGYYGGKSISNSRGQGLVVGFPPGSVLSQLATSTPGYDRTYSKLLVHGATNDKNAANSSVNATDPTQRLIYVGGQTLASGGGAIELTIPSGGWVMYGYQWPEASRANVATNAIVLKQGGVEAPRFTIYRKDGVNGDTSGFNPVYPFKMRGSVDAYGNVPGGVHVSNLTYAIDVPIVTNASFDILARCDASCVNTLIKLDGGIDLNSQMNLGPTNFNGKSSDNLTPTNFIDLRDNKPGYASDVFLGYEQTAFQFRNGPEKFAARNSASNTAVSFGAETYYYTVGGGSNVVAGSGYGAGITNQTVDWVTHDPTNGITAQGTNSPSQRNPLNPTASQSVDVWVKVAIANRVNTCFIYYTADGSNPEGAFGTGKGTTQVVQANWVARDSVTNINEWWKGTIPAQLGGTQVRYKTALFKGGSVYPAESIGTISDAEVQGSKLYGISQFAVTNFNPTTAIVWQHNDLNPANTVTGLQSGFHIIRARTFLPRSGKSSVFNTFSQTFYYDGALPGGVIAYPAPGGTISQRTYGVVVRCDSTVTGVDFNIQDSNTNNDDSITGKANGNGTNVFVAASAVSPDATLSAQYPNYPQEFRFTYTNVPASGSNATITVRLKEFATGIYSNRYTTLTTTVVTLAPSVVVAVSQPTNNAVLTYAAGATNLIQVCFDSSLVPAGTNWNLLINSNLVAQTNYAFFNISQSGVCAGYRSLKYNWVNAQPGTYVIQAIYTNNLPPISDSCVVTIAPPLKISSIANNNQYLGWDSVSGLNYQVLATTNLSQPFQPASGLIQGASGTTYFYDQNPASQKFFEVQRVP
jgi:Alpha amylase, catalytic domain